MTNEAVSIDLASRMLSTFNGDKSILYEFCDNCDKALEVVKDTSQPILFKIIQTKITGNARALIRNRTFANWVTLKEYLLDAYSERRSHGQWQLELSSCKQGQREDVMSYSSKVENCLIKLTNSLDSMLNETERAAYVKLLQKQAMTVFILGLRRELSLVVKTQKPNSLEDAVQYAVAEECELKSRDEIAKFQNVSLRETRYCNNCDLTGHSTFQCFRNRPMNYPRSQPLKTESNVRHVNTDSQNLNQIQNVENWRNRTQKFCRYCKNIGHEIHECRKRQFNNTRRNAFSQPNSPYPNQLNSNSQQNLQNAPPSQPQQNTNRINHLNTSYQDENFANTHQEDETLVSSLEGATSLATLTIEQAIENPIVLLLDSGADISIIKFSQLKKETLCYEDIKSKITGLSNENFESLGYCHLDIVIDHIKYPVIFHVVRDSFPISYPGILGNDAMHNLKLKIDYANDLLHFEHGSAPLTHIRKNLNAKNTSLQFNVQSRNPPQILRLKARTESIIPNEILNPTTKEGIINSFELRNGVLINTLERDVEIDIPKIRLDHLNHEENESRIN